MFLFNISTFAKSVETLKVDTIAYSKTARPIYFYKSEVVTNKAIVKMLDVGLFKKANLGLRKAKRGYVFNKIVSFIAGALVSYPFFSALLNKELYAGPCIMAAGTVLVNINVSKNYNKVLLSLVKEHNQKLIERAKTKNHNMDFLNNHVL